MFCLLTGGRRRTDDDDGNEYVKEDLAAYFNPKSQKLTLPLSHGLFMFVSFVVWWSLVYPSLGTLATFNHNLSFYVYFRYFRSFA